MFFPSWKSFFPFLPAYSFILIVSAKWLLGNVINDYLLIVWRPYDGFPLPNRSPNIHALARGNLSDYMGLSYIACLFSYCLCSFYHLRLAYPLKIYSCIHLFIQIHSTMQAMCWRFFQVSSYTWKCINAPPSPWPHTCLHTHRQHIYNLQILLLP